MYGGDFLTSTLYQVNVTNGGLTTIGNGSLRYWLMGSTTSGLYEYGDGSNLLTNANLYSIDPNTGATTLIGASGIAPTNYWSGLSTGGGTLYLAIGYGGSSLLYSLNTSTGVGTLVGDTGVSKIAAMVFVNGVLYAGSDAGPYSIWTLNTTTGVGTFVANETGAPNEFWGLSQLTSSTTPEPGSILLFGTGLAGVVGAARRKLGSS